MSERKELQSYPEINLSNQLLLHQQEMLQFLFFTNYDIIYETFQLKHGSYSERNRGQLIHSFKSEEIAKNYRVISEKMHLRILRDDIDLDKKLQKLQLLWHNRNIPYFHRYYFIKYLFTAFLKNIQPEIMTQEQLIRTEEHIYYSLFKSINARQACLRNLKKHLAELNPQDVYQYLHVAKQRIFNQRRKNQTEKYKLKGYKLKLAEETAEGKMSKTKFQLFSDCFNHLTKLTLYVIQQIAKWKEYIASLTHDIRKQKERMEYYFYDDNYFLKILTDLGFLKVSFLNQFYEFAPKNDPFLLECVLGFQKKKQKAVEHQLLKLIFMPQKQHVADILSKIQLLSEQYRYNIRSRRVYDLNALKRPIIHAEQKYMNNEKGQQISNLVLKKIQSPLLNKKAKSVATFRVRNNSPSSKKQKIVIQFNKIQSPLRKKLISMPPSIDKQIYQTEIGNPLKNSIILQKNENAVDYKMIDMDLLSMLKKEIIKKVRQDFKIDKQSKSNENQALQLYINNKIKETMKTIFPFEPEKQMKMPIQFSPLSIAEVDLNTQLSKMFKESLPQYHQMQFNQIELLKIIQSSPYAFFLSAKIDGQEIGKIICSLDYDEKTFSDFKILRILYIHFPDLSQLQLLIVQFTKYLFKYENSFEIHYNFFLPSNNDPIKLLLDSLENTLQKECIFGRKQLYSTVIEIKLVFKRREKNINYMPNHFPFSLHLQFGMLLSHKKLMLENRNEVKHMQLLNYDYFLMQAIKRFLTAQDILALKERVNWKSRLRYLVDLMKDEEETDLMSQIIRQIEAINVSQLNNMLTKLHSPFLEVSDIVKNNKLSLLNLELTLTPKYPMKSVYRTNHQQYFRFSIKQRQKICVDSQGTEFYFLQVKQTKDYQICVFNAKEYHKNFKQSDSWLSLYLSERINKEEHGMRNMERQVQSLWIPMARHPHKYKDRQQLFYHTSRAFDLNHLKIDLLLAEKFEWFCSMEVENSIEYYQNDSDIVVKSPYGVAIIAVPSKTIIYSRVFL